MAPLDSRSRRRLAALAATPFLALALAWLSSGGSAAAPREAAGAAAAVEPGWAHGWLSELQGRFPQRVPGSDAQRGAIAFVASSCGGVGLADVELEAIRLGQRFLVNVRAVVPGRDRSRRVVLAAHHDTVRGAPGAIDDGGAIAALLAAARALLAGPAPACDVELLVFDGEEYGLLGSKAHLRRLDDEGRAGVRAALAVELVGWRRDRLVVHTIPHGFAWDAAGIAPGWLPQALLDAGAAAGVPVGVGDPYVAAWYQGTIRLLGVRTGSDAGAYSEAGLPAAMLTGSSLTNFYAAYHRPHDDLRQVDPARLDDAARVIAAAAHELAALPDERADPTVGRAYLLVGGRTLGAAALVAVGLVAALATAAGALVWRAAGAGQVARALGLLAGVLALLSATCSVLGLTVGVPLAAGALLGGAAASPPLRWGALLLGRLPLYAELLLIAAASASFGFRWHGGALETLGLVALPPAGLVAASAARRAWRVEEPPPA